MLDARLHDEPARIDALRALDLMDTPRESAFDRITQLVSDVLEVPVAAVTLLDSDRQWFKSCVGLEINETPRDISFCTHTIRAREPMCIADMRLDARFTDNPFVTGPPFVRSYVGVPLCTPDGYNLGSLCALDYKPRLFTAAQVGVLRSFGDIVVDEIELRRIALVDHLTGAPTRRAFRKEAEKAISGHLRYGRAAVMVVLDIDHFKGINDTHGHSAGDTVLRTVSGALMKLLRKTDSFGRLGGEEFGVIIGEADKARAKVAAESLRAAVEMLEVEHDPPLKVTASFGLAALDQDCLSVDAWLAKADLGVYAAKGAGRNQCCLM